MDYGLFKVHSNGRVIGITGSLIETDDGLVLATSGASVTIKGDLSVAEEGRFEGSDWIPAGEIGLTPVNDCVALDLPKPAVIRLR